MPKRFLEPNDIVALFNQCGLYPHDFRMRCKSKTLEEDNGCQAINFFFDDFIVEVFQQFHCVSYWVRGELYCKEIYRLDNFLGELQRFEEELNDNQ